MKRLILGAAALATVAFALPAAAQVGVRVGDDGVGVRIGDGYHHRHHPGWYRSHAECRVVKIRRTRPDGTTVVTTKRECD